MYIPECVNVFALSPIMYSYYWKLSAAMVLPIYRCGPKSSPNIAVGGIFNNHFIREIFRIMCRWKIFHLKIG